MPRRKVRTYGGQELEAMPSCHIVSPASIGRLLWTAVDDDGCMLIRRVIPELTSSGEFAIETQLYTVSICWTLLLSESSVESMVVAQGQIMLFVGAHKKHRRTRRVPAINASAEVRSLAEGTYLNMGWLD
jgi:hypothetical protein